MMGIHRVVTDASYGELGDFNTQLLSHHINGTSHVVLREVFARDTQELFRASRDNNLTILCVEESNGVAYEITPSAGTSGHFAGMSGLLLIGAAVVYFSMKKRVHG